MDDKTSLTVRIEPKIHWLAFYAAREQKMTLAEFVEKLVRQGITRKAILANEARVSEPTAPEPLQNESLWSEDENARLFNIATCHPDWLSRSEGKLWSAYCSGMARSKKKIDLKTFRQFLTGGK